MTQEQEANEERAGHRWRGAVLIGGVAAGEYLLAEIGEGRLIGPTTAALAGLAIAVILIRRSHHESEPNN